jgi:anti-sigma factor RsiW
MICFRIKESVFMHAHGELRGLPRVMVEYHLSRCPACRAQHHHWAAEGAQWRAALVAQPGLNGSAASVRQAISQRIRSDNSRSAPTPRALSAPSRKLTLIVIGALLALAISAFAAFGPSIVHRIERMWSKTTSTPVDCNSINAPLRTPPGGNVPASGVDPPSGPR